MESIGCVLNQYLPTAYSTFMLNMSLPGASRCARVACTSSAQALQCFLCAMLQLR